MPARSANSPAIVGWSWDGTLDRLHEALYAKCREAASREASSTAAIIDSPECEERGKRGSAIDPAGYDAGKKVKGKKRHVLVDTQGLLMHALVHAADVQDHDGGTLLVASLFGAFPFLLKRYADGGYQGPEFQAAVKKILGRVTVEIVSILALTSHPPASLLSLKAPVPARRVFLACGAASGDVRRCVIRAP